MPLHLLGKKSWHVYNADNVARVRRDEAAAKAAEDAEEQRMQEIDAQRRLAVLRGEAPPPLEDERPEAIKQAAPSRGDGLHRGSFRRKRKRKRPGEDDTDFELRVARERTEHTGTTVETERQPTSSAPIVDHAGHIDLFGSEVTRAHAEKNEEAEREARKKKLSYEDQYTMRFANAAGRDKDGLTSAWYSQSDATVTAPPLKDVWGNEDPRRQERDAQRIVANDPLAMMKRGAGKVRQLNQERRREREERDGDLKALRREERHREKRRRRREERETDHSSRRGEDGRHRSRSGERSRRSEHASRGRRSRDEERRARRDSRSPHRDREDRDVRHRRPRHRHEVHD